MTLDTAIVVALIAAAAGLAGAFLGAAVSSRATLQAARLAAAEARAAREDARQARFADRIIKLAGQLIGASVKVRVDVKAQIDFRRRHPTDRSPVVDFDTAPFSEVSDELRLLVRAPATLAAIDELVTSTLAVRGLALPSSVSGVYHVKPVDDEESEGLQAAYERSATASVVLERSVRQEIGVAGHS